MKYVAYYRVSTQKQSLGLDAQRSACEKYHPIKEFQEQESGALSARPQLQLALDYCSLTHSTLVVARLDRLSRNVAFLAALMDSGVPFICVDNPHATPLTIHVLAALAQHERQLISTRTKEALAAARARGVQLGRRDDAIKRHAATAGRTAGIRRTASATARYEKIRRAISAAGLTGTLAEITRGLSDHGLTVPRATLRRAIAGASA